MMMVWHTVQTMGNHFTRWSGHYSRHRLWSFHSHPMVSIRHVTSSWLVMVVLWCSVIMSCSWCNQSHCSWGGMMMVIATLAVVLSIVVVVVSFTMVLAVVLTIVSVVVIVVIVGRTFRSDGAVRGHHTAWPLQDDVVAVVRRGGGYGQQRGGDQNLHQSITKRFKKANKQTQQILTNAFMFLLERSALNTRVD